jgi:NAD-specific glutamate dehydrogenase
MALAKAQGDIESAQKDSANPFFKSKYADLASVWDACRAPLAKNGLAVIQFPRADGNVVTVETRLVHSSGQWIEGELTAVAKDDGPQSIGSIVTYLRRYSLQSIVGVAPEDDDGNAAQGQDHRPESRAKRVAQQNNMKTGDAVKTLSQTIKDGLGSIDSASADASQRLTKAEDFIYKSRKENKLTDAEKQELDFMVADIQKEIDGHRAMDREAAGAAA